MDTNRQAVLDAALKLPEVDRAVIVEELLATLSPDQEQQLDEVLAAELDCRWEEYQRDRTTAVAWTDLRAEHG